MSSGALSTLEEVDGLGKGSEHISLGESKNIYYIMTQGAIYLEIEGWGTYITPNITS